MALTIDQLNIELTADSKTASAAISELAGTLERLKSALAPIANVNLRVSNSFNNVTKNTHKASNAVQKYDTKTQKAGKSTQAFTQRLAQKISTTRTLVSVFMSAARTMADWFNESNEYIESVNLFNVTMGEGATAAREFADSVSAAMGIDPKEWMQYQGIFKNLTAGFGVASDKANIMSQNLTQLSYDMASFFNADVETAFDKLSSAMSGQVKGLREFGIDTTVASLQEYALTQGIDASVRSMSQAEKSLLRYNYIMEKSILIQGDMARTIITPANSLRILSAQLTQMKRALGNVVSVIAVRFIPYVQAMVQIITEAAAALARLFGFDAKAFSADLSGLGGGFAGGFEDAEESLDGASGAIKKIKKQLMGFDELNIINNPESGGGGGGAGGIGGGGAGLDLEPLEYDFLKGLETGKIDELKEKLKKVLEVVGLIGAGITAWKITNTILDAVGVAGFLTKLPILAGVTLTVTGAILEIKGIKSIITDGIDIQSFTETLLGGGGLVAGGALIGKFFGSTLIGGAIGAIVAGVPIFIAGIYDAVKNGLDTLSALLIPIGSTLFGAGAGLLGTKIGAAIGTSIAPGVGTAIGAVVGLFVGLLTDIGILIYQKWDEIKKFFEPFAKWFDTKITQPIKKTLSKVSSWVNTNIVQPVISFFKPIKEAFEEMKTYALEKFLAIKDMAVERITAILSKIIEIKNKIFEIISALWSYVKTTLIDPIVEKLTNFYKTKIEPIVNLIKSAASLLWNEIKQKVFDRISERIELMKKGLTTIRDWAVEIFKKIGTAVTDYIAGSLRAVVNGALTIIENRINSFIRLLNSAIGIINKIPGVSISTISTIYIPKFAEGGIVDAGQMFIAREAGPELVGTIGNKTAVANNDQIVSGIESGVYRAMMAANSVNRGGSQTIRIINEIDGDVVGEKVIQYHNGKVLQTGVSPLLV